MAVTPKKKTTSKARKVSKAPARRAAPRRRKATGLGAVATQPQKHKPVVLFAIAAGLVGGAYLVKKGVDRLSAGNEDQYLLPSTSSTAKASTSTSAKKTASNVNSGTFPLKYGQKGELIRTLQQALLAKGGNAAAEIRNSGGADAVFGDGTKRALAAAGAYSVLSVDRDSFNRIIGVGQAALPPAMTPTGSVAAVNANGSLSLPNVEDPYGRNHSLAPVNSLRTQLLAAVEAYNPNGAAACVRAMSNVAGYRAVNYGKLGVRWPKDGYDVRVTIATKLAKTFPGNAEIRTALLSIGLGLDTGGNWTAPF